MAQGAYPCHFGVGRSALWVLEEPLTTVARLVRKTFMRWREKRNPRENGQLSKTITAQSQAAR